MPASAGKCDSSSVGRVQPSQGWSRGFEPHLSLTQFNKPMKTKLKAWRLISAKPSDKVVTRDGREVLSWEVIENPKETLWATRVKVKDPADKRRNMTYMVNHNGRRYINIPSDDDIFIEVSVKEHRSKRDCMPDVMKAIEAAKNGDMAGVRSGNKDSGFFRRTNVGDSYYIGSNCDEL